MASFRFAAGDSLVVWVRDRASPPASLPVSELGSALSSVGLVLETRSLPRLSRFELLLTSDEPEDETAPADVPEIGPDSFRIDTTSDSIRVLASTRRGFAYGVWSLMERMGWMWPTPQAVREPDERSWDFGESKILETPALNRRIFYAEQIDLQPELVLWLSRHRFNTLFPSNPTRFSDPEAQVPDRTLEVATDLGFELVVGGDCFSWFLADPEDAEHTVLPEDLGEAEIDLAAKTATEIWEGMAPGYPRLSIHPCPNSFEKADRFVDALLSDLPELTLESTIEYATHRGEESRFLTHVRETDFPLDSETEATQERIERETPKSLRDRAYLFLDYSGWDSRLGQTLSPLLWRSRVRQVDAARKAGLAGVCVGLGKIDAASYMERAAFSLALVARAMWDGEGWDAETSARAVLRGQFEGAGDAVLELTSDMERWFGEAKPELVESDGSLPDLKYAADVLRRERIRDKIYERISEIEESAPCETCIELARSLTTLVGLYDLEECGDHHESRALAHMIWRNNVMDRWPEWLQKASPLAERLKTFL